MKFAFFMPSMLGAGAHRMYIKLASRFFHFGHEVDLVLMTGKHRSFTEELDPGVRVVDLGTPRLWTSLPAFRSYLRKNRPDAVFSSMPLANGIAAWACRFLRRRPRLVISERNALMLVMGEVETPMTARMRYRLLMRIVRHGYRFADALVAISEGVAQRAGEIPGVTPDRIHVIYNPAYPLHLDASKSRLPDHPWLTSRESPVILGVGRLVRQKDFPTLIHAVALLNAQRDVRLLILGEGEDRADLEELAKELGLSAKVSLPGFAQDPLPFMRESSVLVLSSFQEGFGNVLVEAMACGTPVVSTNSPGPSEILDGGRYGPLVPVGDAEALAAAIAAQLDNPTPAEVLKTRAQEFSIDASAEAYLKLAEDLCTRRA